MPRGKETSSRIPIRFAAEESATAAQRQQSLAGKGGSPESGGDAGELTPDELGRASIYEDATEMQRRIDRGGAEEGAEGRSQADDKDTGGGPHPADLPENRTDEDTTPRDPDARDDSPYPEKVDDRRNASPAGDSSAADLASGPALAELIATRAELRRLEGEVEKVAAERGELRDQLARRQAEFDNYRKRVERERGETYKQIVGDVVNKLLPVIDNLRRALDAEAAVEAQESKEFGHFLEGVELIYKQLNEVLAKYGVESVPTVGQPFDPHIHEAIAAEASDDYEPDTVIQEIARGYRLGDKLLRPAMVKVASR